LHLDFKTIGNANMRGNDDKRNLAKCLSGFANSSGGIIVWGVDARKNAQGIDCASAAAEIAPVRLFLSRLNELTGDAVSPIVDGIQHKAIETTQDSGFAVTLVPESESGPYMAKLGEDRYYKRSGDSFYKMEHFDLEDMFGRRQKPRLLIHLSNLSVPDDNTHEDLRFNVQNTGRATARHVGFFVNFENVEIAQVIGSHLQNISHLNEGRTVVSYINNLDVIHPTGILVFAGDIRCRRKNPAEDIVVEASSYCENARLVKTTVAFAPLQQPAEAAPQQG
jgi:Predicted transcriptional regulator containing an HTH domain and an uncharacterized domain shared with the mammalian protein Schlafen